MFDWLWRRKRNPEVDQAIKVRDALFDDAQDAMDDVDRLTGEKASRQERLIADYKRANGIRREKP